MADPGSEGSIGPFPQDYSQPHVYARDITSGAGNCVCAGPLGDGVHTEAAPGIPVPVGARSFPALGDVRKGASAEQRYVLGIAYQAGPDPRIAKGVDGGRDYFTAEELEKAAWSLMRNGPRSGLFHIDGTDADGGAAQIVESYIYRNDEPWDLGDGVVVRKGDWLVGAILTPRAWELHKAGKINGLSPQGVARRRRRITQTAKE